jgi:membrane-associated phospholipid phosphatase
MRKFTTIILLFSIFIVSQFEIKAQNTDFRLLQQVNGIENTVGLSKFISNTTTTTAALVPTTMAVVALIGKDDDLLKDAVYVGLSMGLNTALTYSLKNIINRPRPYTTYPNDIVAYESMKSMSFPSGHTSIAFATATALSLKYPKWYVIAPSYAWASYVGYSRMNLGVHYPSDVLAGAVLGAGSAWLTYKVNEWYWKKNANKKLLALQSYL